MLGKVDIHKLKAMELHDQIKAKSSTITITIIRVPNGWLYKYPAQQGPIITFVPEN